MICTPEQAYEKFCPFGRFRNLKGTKLSLSIWKNENGTLDYVRCRGDKCMLWNNRGDGTGYCGMSMSLTKAIFSDDI